MELWPKESELNQIELIYWLIASNIMLVEERAIIDLFMLFLVTSLTMNQGLDQTNCHLSWSHTPCPGFLLSVWFSHFKENSYVQHIGLYV